jgi:hypothetical protein
LYKEGDEGEGESGGLMMSSAEAEKFSVCHVETLLDSMADVPGDDAESFLFLLFFFVTFVKIVQRRSYRRFLDKIDDTLCAQVSDVLVGKS